MFEVEECDDEGKQLISVTKLCLKNAIDICKPNENFSSIGNDYCNLNDKKFLYFFSIFR